LFSSIIFISSSLYIRLLSKSNLSADHDIRVHTLILGYDSEIFFPSQGSNAMNIHNNSIHSSMKNFFIIHLLFIKLSTNNQNQIEKETSANIVSNQTILLGLTTTFILHHNHAFVNIAKNIDKYQRNHINHNLAKVTTHIIADISNNDVNLIEKANQARSQIIRIIYKKPHP
jgi:Mg2+ and Co2+ transporter CorA